MLIETIACYDRGTLRILAALGKLHPRPATYHGLAFAIGADPLTGRLHSRTAIKLAVYKARRLELVEALPSPRGRGRKVGFKLTAKGRTALGMTG